MQTDVKSLAIAANNGGAVAIAGRNRLKAITIVFAATNGTVAITDGSGGNTLFSFPAPTAIGTIHILIPGEGILATTNLYVTTGAGASAIIYYG